MINDPNIERLIENAIKPLRKEVKKMNDKVNELKIQLSRVHKDSPDPRERSPYDLSRR